MKYQILSRIPASILPFSTLHHVTRTFLLDKFPVCIFLISEGFSDLAASIALLIVGTELGLSKNLRFPEKFIDCSEHNQVHFEGTKLCRLHNSIQMSFRFCSFLLIGFGDEKKFNCSTLFAIACTPINGTIHRVRMPAKYLHFAL